MGNCVQPDGSATDRAGTSTPPAPAPLLTLSGGTNTSTASLCVVASTMRRRKSWTPSLAMWQYAAALGCGQLYTAVSCAR
jgi:hypothetical protein